MTSNFFIANRSDLRGLLPDNALVITTAQSLLQRSGDTTYPFRQDSNFYYLTGINEADMVLVMAGGEELLILPKRSKAEDIFGGIIDCDEIAKISGINKICEHKEGWERYKKLQKSRKNIYTLGAASSKVVHTDSFFTNPARRGLIQKLKRLSPNASVIDIRPQLAEMRMIKQPEEIDAIKKAIEITGAALELARKNIKPGKYEHDIAAVFDSFFTASGATHGYQPIVASGKSACRLHYIKNNQPIKDSDLVLIDVGAEFNNYSADITRTYAADNMTKRQTEVYEAVSQLQELAISLLKPGLAWKDWSHDVEGLMGEKLKKLGLIKSDSREAIRQYFPHGIGHSLGLDVHDVCDYKIIKENMVITVEPGIYIPQEGIGVRIEDDVLITKNGAENLSSDISYA